VRIFAAQVEKQSANKSDHERTLEKVRLNGRINLFFYRGALVIFGNFQKQSVAWISIGALWPRSRPCPAAHSRACSGCARFSASENSYDFLGLTGGREGIRAKREERSKPGRGGAHGVRRPTTSVCFGYQLSAIDCRFGSLFFALCDLRAAQNRSRSAHLVSAYSRLRLCSAAHPRACN
jgi:hypothetical protein